MNKELQDRLLEYLGSLEGAVRQAGGFVTEQAPLVAQEWVEYEFWSNLLPCVAQLLVGAVLLFGAGWFLRQQFRNKDEPWAFGTAALCLIACMPLCFGTECGMRALKAKIAPRVVVLEKLVSLTEQVRP